MSGTTSYIGFRDAWRRCRTGTAPPRSSGQLALACAALQRLLVPGRPGPRRPVAWPSGMRRTAAETRLARRRAGTERGAVLADAMRGGEVADRDGIGRCRPTRTSPAHGPGRGGGDEGRALALVSSRRSRRGDAPTPVRRSLPSVDSRRDGHGGAEWRRSSAPARVSRLPSQALKLAPSCIWPASTAHSSPCDYRRSRRWERQARARW